MLQSMGLQRVGHNLGTEQHTQKASQQSKVINMNLPLVEETEAMQVTYCRLGKGRRGNHMQKSVVQMVYIFLLAATGKGFSP